MTTTDLLEAVAEVDALPNPERGPLAGVSLIRVVRRGTRAAMAMARRDPEAAPGELARHVDPLAAVDCTRQDPDTWYRHGAVQGAKDAWLGAAFRPPPDCPPGEPAMAYVIAYNNAATVVHKTRMEVG